MAESRRIYNQIKSKLAAKRKSSKQLAEHLGIKPQTVSSWCTNKRQPRLDELYAISDFLDMPPIELLEPWKKEQEKEDRKDPEQP